MFAFVSYSFQSFDVNQLDRSCKSRMITLIDKNGFFSDLSIILLCSQYQFSRSYLAAIYVDHLVDIRRI